MYPTSKLSDREKYEMQVQVEIDALEVVNQAFDKTNIKVNKLVHPNVPFADIKAQREAAQQELSRKEEAALQESIELLGPSGGKSFQGALQKERAEQKIFIPNNNRKKELIEYFFEEEKENRNKAVSKMWFGRAKFLEENSDAVLKVKATAMANTVIKKELDIVIPVRRHQDILLERKLKADNPGVKVVRDNKFKDMATKQAISVLEAKQTQVCLGIQLLRKIPQKQRQLSK
ncbi:MAG: hypothetical protein Ta2D_11290 [Rickettsiales bacterium]|nr:MAG: hypothetical protein Ta2D_11290 [Rickettsiales bacterium]